MNTTAFTDTLRVVIIDDDSAHSELMNRSIETVAGELADHVEIACFGDPAAALASLTGETNCIIICDYHLDGCSALDWIPDFVRGDHGPILITTSSGSEQGAIKSFRSGAADYINKSNAFSDSAYLATTLRECLRRHRLSKTVQDLSVQLRRANRELAYKNEQLEATTQAAHAFVDDVAHDFRTPLSVIKEFASIMSDGLAGPVTNEQVDHLDYVDRATDELAGMIDDFLDSARLRAGLLRLDRRAIAAGELVEGILPAIRSRARAKSITLEIDVPESLPGVFVDPLKASRVLMNLVTNAIKFSPENSTVRVSAEVSDPCWIRYSVSDSGPGIAPDDLKLIFERFQQVDTAQCSRIKGFGLGLSIATQLAAINFGRLEADSAPGVGSVFSAVLPQSDPEALLRACIRYFEAQNERTPLAVLRCTPEASATCDELAAYLGAACRTHDLIMETTDGTVLAIGPAEEPHEWVRRLTTKSQDATLTDNVGTPRFRTDLLGAWKWPVSEDAVLAVAGMRSELRRAA